MGTPEPRPIRIGTVEREQAVQALGDHFAQGRLDPHEFEERTTAAYAARTAAELDVLFADLPTVGGQYPAAPSHPASHPAPHPAPAVPPPGTYPVAYDPQAPYGREPETGAPYSDRSKLVAGLLQVCLPVGIGRFYSGHAGTGMAQLLLSFVGIGLIWAFLDGIVILIGRPRDGYGRPLRP